MEQMANYIQNALLAALLGVLIRYGIPYVKSLLTEKKLAFLTVWVDRAVKAAEQTIRGSGLGEEKKAFVLSLLEKLGIIADETVDALIEAAVKELNDAADQVSAALEEGAKKAGAGA